MSVLGVAGAAIGFFVGGPSGAALGYSIGSGIDAAVNAPDRVGPRLEDLRVQLSQYGAMVPFEWGTNRHAGTIIWPRILEAIEHREEESAKGGPDNVTFRYTLSCAVLLCEGPITGVRRIWANKKIVYDVSEGNTGPTQDPAVGTIRFHLGTEDQMMDPLIEATDGPGPAYRGYAYVVFENYDVTELNGRPPQWEFEVVTEGSEEIQPATTFGEAYELSDGNRSTFSADIDPNGHIWLSTMNGHAWVNPATGELEVSAGGPGIPQIHEYDSATGKLLWSSDVPPITEKRIDGTVDIVYPMRGHGVYGGGYYFIGRGKPGLTTEEGPYAHGTAVNTETRAVEFIFNQCSTKQFQNSFYSPSVPVPVINNNKVYFASGSGLEAKLGVGFMPASIDVKDNVDIDPIPDFSGPKAKWNVPVGWAQARAKAPCPVRLEGGTEPSFDGTGMQLPGWAIKSTVIYGPEGVIVQGYGEHGSYIALATFEPHVVEFDLLPATVMTCELPGSKTIMPAIIWDPVRLCIWAFAGEQLNMLYQITIGGGLSPGTEGGLTPTFTGFMLPEVPGEFQSNTVQGITLDQATGYLRIIRGSGPYGHVSLVDPATGSVVSDAPISVGLEPISGSVWDIPGTNKVVMANGFGLYSIPYAANLSPGGIPLYKIVADICYRAGLAESDIDVSELTDIVDGYIVPRQMTARAAIEPLQQAFFFDAVESDDRIKFVKRGKSEVTIIPIEDRAAHEHGQEVPDGLTITRAFELELPVQCDVEYPDIEADHLVGNQSDRRITKDTRHNLNLQLPIVMTANKAKSVARTLLYEAWQNQSFRFATSRKYAHLEPTSLVELPTESASYRGRITGKRELPNGVIEWQARVDSVTVYTQTGEGAVPIGHVPQTIFRPSTTYLEMLDIPLLRDQDEDAGFYVAMGGV